MKPEEWHIITSEYPPAPGGVSDYARSVAAGLAAAGEAVHVWCPPVGADQSACSTPGVSVHAELGGMRPADLRRVGRALDRLPAPRRLFVQWVPHGYGYRSMNLPFCLWLWRRARLKGDAVELMIHEPFLAFGEGSRKQSAVAAVHRVMIALLLHAARRVWMSIPAWEKSLRPYALGRRLPFVWLPVASNIPRADDPEGVREVRARYAPGGELVVGHFGTYGRNIADLLESSVPVLLGDCENVVLLLLGRGGEQLRDRLARDYPGLRGRIHAPGALGAAELSRHVGACDVMFQPYPDGISSRRTSAMVGLSHGLPLVTTTGHLTERLWAASGAAAVAPVGDVAALNGAAARLLSDAEARKRAGAAASGLYRERFETSKTIAALRAAGAENQAPERPASEPGPRTVTSA